jgi:hypothetical protein
VRSQRAPNAADVLVQLAGGTNSSDVATIDTEFAAAPILGVTTAAWKSVASKALSGVDGTPDGRKPISLHSLSSQRRTLAWERG